MITPVMVDNFRTDFESAVKVLEQKYNVKVDLGSITYNSTSFRAKVTVNDKSANPAEVFAAKASKWKMCGQGIKADWYGKFFTSSEGKKYKIVDLRPAAKYCIIIEDAFGKQTACIPSFISKWC